MNHLQSWFQLAAVALLIGAAVQDLRTRTISNGWPIAILLLFLIAYATGGIAGPIGSHILHFGLALAVGVGLFALGWIGGGDAKLYAAIALWFDITRAPSLFFCVAITGLVLAAVHLSVRMFQTQETRARAIREGKIAYGVAIALGATLALALALGLD